MMKEISWSKSMTRHYQQRIANDEQLTEAFWDSVETFVVDPTLVNDHSLQNIMQGKRAFSINEEYQVVYLERDKYYLFLDVGTHEQVYRR
jgi:mRNA-degrading endonuclease YafQ of YafQ-DinJ toxin-antitoxin module